MNKMRIACFILFFVLLELGSMAQPLVAVDSLMQYCKSDLHFNGVVVVADSNKIIYEKVFQKNDALNNEQIKAGTRFRLGSMSKQFTAFLILQLAEKGELSLDDPLAKYFAAFNEEGKRTITIRNLLTHTSGIADYTTLDNFNDQLYYQEDSIVQMIAASPLSFYPGNAYMYCNSNFYLLALIIEKITKKDFNTILNEMIFKKAGMPNSGEEEGKVAGEVKGYMYKNNLPVVAPFIEMKNTKGGGGMYSTAEDLFKWSVFFQRALTKDSVIKKTIQPFTLQDGKNTIYSCGWCLMPGLIFHMGHINGFANLIAIDTTRKQTIIILTNDDYRQLYITMETIRNILHGEITAIKWVANKPLNNLHDYTGTYSIGDLKINIKDTSVLLAGQAFGQTNFLRWFSNDAFFFLDMEGFVKFERDNAGNVARLKSLQDYNWVTLKKE